MCAPPPKSCLRVYIPGGSSLSLHGTSVLGSNSGVRFSSRWLYEGISRSKAEELLLLPSNSEGYFLVRESQMKKGIESLQKSSDSLDSREQSRLKSVAQKVQR